MKTFDKAVVTDVSSALQDMIGRTVDVDDLCEAVSESQSADGFWVYGTEESADFLREYRIEAAEMFDEVNACGGDINPFAEPEQFLCIMYIIRSHEIIASLPWILAHEGATVQLTHSDVLALVNELDGYCNGDDRNQGKPCP